MLQRENYFEFIFFCFDKIERGHHWQLGLFVENTVQISQMFTHAFREKYFKVVVVALSLSFCTRMRVEGLFLLELLLNVKLPHVRHQVLSIQDGRVRLHAGLGRLGLKLVEVGADGRVEYLIHVDVQNAFSWNYSFLFLQILNVI